MFTKILRYLSNFALPIKKKVVTATFMDSDQAQVNRILGEIANLSTKAVDEHDEYVNRLIDQAKRKQDELLKLKVVSQEQLKMVVGV